MIKTIIGTIIGILIIGGGYMVIKPQEEGRGGSGFGQLASSCEVQTSSVTIIGNDESTRLLATTSRRAWARIQMPTNATNTASITFNEDVASTLTTGVLLGELNSTSTTNYIDFGLNTDFPYTGSVTGLTNAGSTTVHVTECNYIK